MSIPHRLNLPAKTLALLLTSVFALAGLAACGSSPHSSAILGTKTQQDCTAVSDVLSDGPDPDADSVGYAQAQVLPLKRLKISEVNLQTAVSNLASAYQIFATSTGSAARSAAIKVSGAESAVNAICPGAAS